MNVTFNILFQSNYGGELLETVKLNSTCVYSLAYSNTHHLMAVAGSSPTIQFIDTNNNIILKSFNLQPVKS